MSASTTPLVVTVTGGSGYLASEIIHQLIQKGYTVRTTVRGLNSSNAESLRTLFPSVLLYEADLLKEGSFDEALQGADVVIHTASPFPSKVVDAQKEVIDPALNGTKNVLASVASHPSIKRVVITGSCAAVVEHYPTDDGSKVWTEDDWNTTSTLTEGPYRLSKVVAEKYAWEWSSAHPDVSVAVILPTFIIGPPQSGRADATSIKTVKELLDGTTKAGGGAPALSFGAVDVRNVAEAHIVAFEKNAKGRFILSSEEGIPRIQYARVLKAAYPHLPIPDVQIGEITYKFGTLLPQGRYSNQKSKQILGIQYIPFDQSLLEMAKKLIEFGIVKSDL